MNPIVFVLRRPVTTLMFVGVLISGGVLASNTMRTEIIQRLNSPKTRTYLEDVGVRAKQVKDYVVSEYESYFHKQEGEEIHQESHKILVTSPEARDVVTTEDFVCQIHSKRHIDVCALENGYLEEIPIREGQAVKTGDVLFRIKPVLYKARADAENAEAELAKLEFNNTKKLFDDQKKIVSQNELLLFQAKLAKARAKAALAQAELDFATIKAPFDGIVDRLLKQQGSLVKEGEILTTLSDNSVMWVYFNVPEKRYLQYMAEVGRNMDSPDIELVLANGEKFHETGKIGAIEAKFNNENGNIAFRADFPNPKGLLRHGQTGTVLINRLLKGAIVIPQRATFENLAKRYVYVVDKDDVAHQREIVIEHVLEDIFVIGGKLGVNDKIVLEGTRQIRDGEKLEYEFVPPEKVLANQKNHAE